MTNSPLKTYDHAASASSAWSPETPRWPTPIHKAEQANPAVFEKTHGTSIVNRMITQAGMMRLNTWHQPRDSCELDLLDRMHPSESIGFPFWASYPRLSVCSCISVMKAIITTWKMPLTLDIEIPSLRAVNIINNSIQDIIAILIIPYIQVWPEHGVISCIHDDIPRRHEGNHWKSEHDEPGNPPISRQTSPFRTTYYSASRIVPSYNPMKTHRIPHCSQQSQNDCHITFIMNKPRNPASWTHTTTAFIENMKPMKSINKQHIHHTLRNRTTFAHPERNSHEQTSTKPLPNHPCSDNHLKRQYTQ